jgi:hypothetical protein
LVNDQVQNNNTWNTFVYCYHSVSIMSFSLFHSEHIRPLFFKNVGYALCCISESSESKMFYKRFKRYKAFIICPFSPMVYLIVPLFLGLLNEVYLLLWKKLKVKNKLKLKLFSFNRSCNLTEQFDISGKKATPTSSTEKN